MTIDCRAYLPTYGKFSTNVILTLYILDTVTIYFLKDLMCGKKKYIKNDKLRHLEIPYYSTLTVKEIYSFIGEHPDTHIYYPDSKEVPRLPRQ